MHPFYLLFLFLLFLNPHDSASDTVSRSWGDGLTTISQPDSDSNSDADPDEDVPTDSNDTSSDDDDIKDALRILGLQESDEGDDDQPVYFEEQGDQENGDDDSNPPTHQNPVPEPATLILFGSGAVAAFLRHRFKRN